MLRSWSVVIPFTLILADIIQRMMYSRMTWSEEEDAPAVFGEKELDGFGDDDVATGTKVDLPAKGGFWKNVDCALMDVRTTQKDNNARASAEEIEEE